MKRYHATPRKNLPGIMRAGLLMSKAKGKRRAVWTVTASQSAWAVLHVAGRHGTHAENVVVLEVEIPRSKLKRHSRKGVCYCEEDIPPENVREVWSFARLAAS